MRFWSAAAVCLLLTASTVRLPREARGDLQADTLDLPPCEARTPASGFVLWHAGDEDDAPALNQWCQGVGAPVVVPAPDAGPTPPPALDELVVLSWNAHLGDGRLDELVARLRAGGFTEGQPVRHFVILVQELYRRGPDVPAFPATARAASAIASRLPDAPDAHDYSRSLDLSVFYVPSMRNGSEMREDRGNAIVSSEPLHGLFAVELPFERQRRVAIGAEVTVMTPAGARPLPLVNVHLDPLSSSSSLWVFRNPRRRQLGAVLNLLAGDDRPTAGAILGGDFNTVQGGPRELVYADARRWARGPVEEDPRGTHRMGRLDYLFFRLPDGWQASTERLDERFGSDHHPVLGRLTRTTPES